MSTKKKYILGFLIVFIPFLIWYFFIKESDYVVKFKAKTSTGTVFQEVKDLSNISAKKLKESYKILNKNNFDYLKQKMSKGQTTMEYTWEFESLNDTTTEVTVGIKDVNHSLYNRLTVPFFSTAFKETQIGKIKEFKTGLEEYLKDFKLKVNGEGTSQPTFVAYINVKSVLKEKAQDMIANDGIITGYLFRNNIKIIGKPYLEILNWDFDSDKLDYNYCFPIDKSTKYIPDTSVKFKTIPAQKGITATYFGNYKSSDRAWFAILDYAKKNNLKLDYKPLEHFFANPFNGGEEIKWKTEIIIPFVKK